MAANHLSQPHLSQPHLSQPHLIGATSLVALSTVSARPQWMTRNTFITGGTIPFDTNTSSHAGVIMVKTSGGDVRNAMHSTSISFDDTVAVRNTPQVRTIRPNTKVLTICFGESATDKNLTFSESTQVHTQVLGDYFCTIAEKSEVNKYVLTTSETVTHATGIPLDIIVVTLAPNNATGFPTFQSFNNNDAVGGGVINATIPTNTFDGAVMFAIPWSTDAGNLPLLHPEYFPLEYVTNVNLSVTPLSTPQELTDLGITDYITTKNYQFGTNGNITDFSDVEQNFFRTLGSDFGTEDFLNEEYQRYKEDNSSTNAVFNADSMDIVARLENAPSIASGDISSLLLREKTTRRYGYLSAEFTCPPGQGMWPALWMFTQSVSWLGDGNGNSKAEWDLLELVTGQAAPANDTTQPFYSLHESDTQTAALNEFTTELSNKANATRGFQDLTFDNLSGTLPDMSVIYGADLTNTTQTGTAKMVDNLGGSQIRIVVTSGVFADDDIVIFTGGSFDVNGVPSAAIDFADGNYHRWSGLIVPASDIPRHDRFYWWVQPSGLSKPYLVKQATQEWTNSTGLDSEEWNTIINLAVGGPLAGNFSGPPDDANDFPATMSLRNYVVLEDPDLIGLYRNPDIDGQALLSISNATDQVEGTDLVFSLTFDDDPASSITIEYDVDIAGDVTTGLTKVLSTTDSIIVSIPNDNTYTGDRLVTVTLTSIISGNAAFIATVGMGTIIENDEQPIPPVFSRKTERGTTTTNPSDFSRKVDRD